MLQSVKSAIKTTFQWILRFREAYCYINALEVPPGHFYSPIPSIAEIKLKERQIFDAFPRTIPGIDLNENYQLELLSQFKQYYDEQPFSPHKTEGLRYHFENHLYPYSDGLILYCIIRHYRPSKIIEVGGSGYSSCLILDTNERFMNNSIQTVCVEPYLSNIISLLALDDEPRFRLISEHVQDVATGFFEKLLPNDILFIDSSHVSKINSDVNCLLFQILPTLQSGVLIHMHDVFYPFEYPKEWIYNKRAWNENYILRAFLQYNTSFRIEFWNTFLQRFHRDAFVDTMPLCLSGIEYEWNGPHTWYGGSIWIRKL